MVWDCFRFEIELLQRPPEFGIELFEDNFLNRIPVLWGVKKLKLFSCYLLVS